MSAFGASSPKEIARIRHGNLLQNQGRLREAEEEYRAVLQVNPTSALAHYNLANSLLTRGEVDEAEDHYRAAIEANPQYVDAMNNLASIFMAQDRYVEADDLLRVAVQLSPDDPELHYNYARTGSEVGLLDAPIGGDPARHFRRALELRPNFPQAHHYLACFLDERTTDAEAAEKHFREALRLEPRYAGAHFNFGRFLRAQGRSSEACERFRDAYRLDPQNPNFARAARDCM